MHIYFVVVEGPSGQANQHNTIHAPDSTQCNISLTMCKDVWTQVNDSPTQAETLNFVDIDCPFKNYGELIPVKLILAISTIDPIGGMMHQGWEVLFSAWAESAHPKIIKEYAQATRLFSSCATASRPFIAYC